MKRSLVTTILFLVCTLMAHAEDRLQILEENSIRIEYPESFAVLAEPLHEWLDATLTVRGFGREHGLFPYSDAVDEIGEHLIERLAMENHREEILASFQAFCDRMEEEMKPYPDPRFVRLWDEVELRTIFDNGGQIPGFRMNPLQGEIERIPAQSGSLSMFPVAINAEEKESLLEQAKNRLRPVIEGIQPVLLHGVTTQFASWIEERLVLDLHLTGAYRQWFVTGVSHAMMLNVLQAFYHPQVALHFSKEYDTLPYKDRVDAISLGDWIAAEYLDSDYDKERTRLRTIFATGEIQAFMERNGSESLPAVFNAIQQDESGPRDIGVILRAIHSVTDEDFREHLKIYQSEQP